MERYCEFLKKSLRERAECDTISAMKSAWRRNKHEAKQVDMGGRIACRRSPVLRLCGKTTLGEMMELLRRADAVVSNDSGPIHAAAALRRPVPAASFRL